MEMPWDGSRVVRDDEGFTEGDQASSAGSEAARASQSNSRCRCFDAKTSRDLSTA